MITAYHPYSIARLPRIEFGSGRFNLTAQITAQFGRRLLVVTGAKSFPDSQGWQRLLDQFDSHNLSYAHLRIDGEPSPAMVDEAVKKYADGQIDVVLGIGGGSAMDAA
jgi:alcohol dehydrogenase